MDYILLQRNVRNLPNEIQHIIISYTYSPQSVHLLEDIRDYSKTIQTVYDYLDEIDLLNSFYLETAIDDIHDQLHTYIYYYICNGNINEVTNMYWKRYIMYQSMENEDILRLLIERVNEYPLYSQIRILWGLLLPTERDIFLDIIIAEYFEEEEEDYDF